MCIAVTDESGDLKAFYRMDGAPKLSIQIAEDGKDAGCQRASATSSAAPKTCSSAAG